MGLGDLVAVAVRLDDGRALGDADVDGGDALVAVALYPGGALVGERDLGGDLVAHLARGLGAGQGEVGGVGGVHLGLGDRLRVVLAVRVGGRSLLVEGERVAGPRHGLAGAAVTRVGLLGADRHPQVVAERGVERFDGDGLRRAVDDARLEGLFDLAGGDVRLGHLVVRGDGVVGAVLVRLVRLEAGRHGVRHPDRGHLGRPLVEEGERGRERTAGLHPLDRGDLSDAEVRLRLVGERRHGAQRHQRCGGHGGGPTAHGTAAGRGDAHGSPSVVGLVIGLRSFTPQDRSG